MAKRITPEQITEIKTLRDQGISVNRAAIMIGITRGTISIHVPDGWSVQKTAPATPERIAEMQRMYDRGDHINEVMRTMGCSSQTFYKYVKLGRDRAPNRPSGKPRIQRKARSIANPVQHPAKPAPIPVMIAPAGPGNPLDANGLYVCHRCGVNPTDGHLCSPCAVAGIRAERPETLQEKNIRTYQQRVMMG